MAVRSILRMGDERLLIPAVEVDRLDTPELHDLIADLRDTMQAADGAGLAAPQIGVLSRVVIFGIDHNPRYPDAEAIPETVLINPVITPLSQEIREDWEGCLSLPGLRGMVPRFSHILYSGFDMSGQPVEREAHDFHARVVQHECDHLDGVLYPMRMTDMRRFGFTDILFPEPGAGGPA